MLLDISDMNEPSSTRAGAVGAGTVGAGQQQEIGMYILGSPKMEEAVYVGYDGANVFVDMRAWSHSRPQLQWLSRQARA